MTFHGGKNLLQGIGGVGVINNNGEWLTLVNHIHPAFDFSKGTDTFFYFFRSAWQEFSRNYDFVAFGKVAQSSSDKLLAGTALVCDCRVIKVYSEIQSASDYLS